MRLAASAFVLSAALLLAACAADSGAWTKAGVESNARDADLLACRADTTQKVKAEARQPYAFHGARYSYMGPRHGLFGPGGHFDDSDVRRQIEGEIEARYRSRWRALFGTCMEARGYRYEQSAPE